MKYINLLIVILLTGCLPKDAVWSTWGETPQWGPERALLVYAEDDIDNDVIEEALDTWERGTCNFLYRTDDKAGADIVVERGFAKRTIIWDDYDQDYRHWDGSAWFDKTEHKGHAYIHTPGSITWEYLIVTHEIGHILGLDHDRSRMSIMRRGAHATYRVPYPQPSYQDRDAIRSRYCK